jgi:hypothetical protein
VKVKPRALRGVLLCSAITVSQRRSLTEKGIMLGLAEVERRQIDLRPVAFPPGLLKRPTQRRQDHEDDWD